MKYILIYYLRIHDNRSLESWNNFICIVYHSYFCIVCILHCYSTATVQFIGLGTYNLNNTHTHKKFHSISWTMLMNCYKLFVLELDSLFLNKTKIIETQLTVKKKKKEKAKLSNVIYIYVTNKHQIKVR